jgi:hypothetical protein
MRYSSEAAAAVCKTTCETAAKKKEKLWRNPKGKTGAFGLQGGNDDTKIPHKCKNICLIKYLK